MIPAIESTIFLSHLKITGGRRWNIVVVIFNDNSKVLTVLGGRSNMTIIKDGKRSKEIKQFSIEPNDGIGRVLGVRILEVSLLSKKRDELSDRIIGKIRSFSNASFI